MATKRKRKMARIYEPAENATHYAPPAASDQVTLCGITDWIGAVPPHVTEKPVSCALCKRIVQHVLDHDTD